MKNMSYKQSLILEIKRMLLVLIVFSCGNNVEIIASRIPQTNSENPQQTLVVEDLRLTEIASNSATVSWTPHFNSDGMLDDTVIYQVSVLLYGEEVFSEEIKNPDSNMFYQKEINSLITGFPYQIIVKSQNLVGEVLGQASIWTIPSDIAISGSSAPEKMLTEVLGVTNSSGSGAEVVWVENDQASVYVVMATEENNALTGALTEIKSEKIIQVVCAEEMIEAGCTVVERDEAGNMKNEIAVLKAETEYTIIVIPITFQDLTGLRGTDDDGNEITLEDGIKELIGNTDSLINDQIEKVVEEILKENESVVSKTKVISITVDNIPSPINLAATAYKSEIHVSWDLVNEATDYEVVLFKNDGSSYLTNNVSRSDASLILNGNAVFYGTVEGTYIVKVTSYSGSKRGGSVLMEITVNANAKEFIKPNQITDLQVNNNALGEMTLSWATTERDSLTGYHIYYYQTDKPSRPNYTADKGETNLTINNISPGSYVVRVDAVAGGVIVEGIGVNNIIYATPEPVGSLLVRISASDEVNGNADVSWISSETGSPAEEFVVDYLKGVSAEIAVSNDLNKIMGLDWSGAENLTVLVEANNTAYKVNVADLNTKTEINVFRVKSVNRSGESEYGYYILEADQTSSPSVVENINFSSYNTGSFTVAWESPSNGGSDMNGDAMGVTGYKVSLRESGSSDYLSSDVLPVNTLLYIISGLEIGVQYDVLIQAKNDANGKENYNTGEMVSVWTSSQPSEVSGITYSDWSMSGFTINWNAPTDFGKKDDGTGENYPAVTYMVTVYDAATNQIKIYENITGTVQVITDVDSGKKYYATVVAKNDTGFGPIAKNEYTWLPSVPGLVGDLKASDYTAGGFTLSWSAPSDPGKKNDGSGDNAIITGYKVMISRDGGVNFETETVSITSKTFTDLEPGVAYPIRVLAVNANGDGVANQTMRVWTGSLPENVGMITTDSGMTNISVAWSEISPGKQGITDGGVGDGSDALTSYRVEYKEDLENAEYREFAIIPGTDVNIIGLTGGTSYRIRVTSLNEYGSSNPAESEPATTLSMATVPGVPGEITINEIMSDTITLSWVAPSDTGLTPQGSGADLTGYVLEYSNGGMWTGISTTETTATTATVDGLTGATTYGFRVSAVNAEGRGSVSEVVAATTLSMATAPGAIELINVDTVTTDTVTISWVAPSDTGLTPQGSGADLTGYVLEYSNGGVWTGISITETTETTATTATVDGLTGATTYGFRVSAVNAEGRGSVSEVVAATTLSMATAPGAIELINVDTVTTDTVTISWVAPSDTGLTPQGSGADLTGYVLEYSNGGMWTGISITETTETTATTATVDGLTGATTYGFRVSAVNAEGRGSVSEVVAATTLSMATAPGAIELINVDTVTTDTVTISWVAPSDTGLTPQGSGADLTGYVLEYSNGGVWTGISITETTETTATTATVDGLTGATTYGFRVSAVNAEGRGSVSEVVAVTTLSMATAPGAIELINVDTVTTDTVTISWAAPVNPGLTPQGSGADLTGYVLEYSNGGVWTEISTTETTATTATVDGLTGATTYGFRVSAVNAEGRGSVSEVVAATTLSMATAPGAIELINVDTVTTDTVTISWVAPSDTGLTPQGSGADLTGYVLEYSNGGVWTGISITETTETTATTATVDGLTGATTYGFRVSAVNAEGRGSVSEVVAATTLSMATAPGAIELINVDTVTTDTVTISWVAPSDTGLTPQGSGADLTGYVLEYSNGGVWTGISITETTETTATTATVDGLTGATTYGFRVSAVNSEGRGSVSEVVAATTLSMATAPGAIELINVDTVTTDTVTISWVAPSDTGLTPQGSGADLTGYVLEYSNGGVWTEISTTETTATTATVDGLTGATTYGFRVSAVNAEGRGSVSEVVAATTLSMATAPGAIELINVDTVTTDTVTISWVAPSDTGLTPQGSGADLTGYVLEYSNGGVWTGISITETTETTATTATVDGLTGATTYGFRVSAVNSEGRGSVSEEITATTLSMATVPGVPGEITINEIMSDTITLSWSAPVNTGLTPQGSGADLTGYVLEYSNGGVWTGISITETTATTATVDGLTGATTYGFRVSAVNDEGTGAATELIIVVTPAMAAEPGVPGDFTAVSTIAGTAELSWAAPVNTGFNPDGSPADLIGYVLEYNDGSGNWTTLSKTDSGIRLSQEIGTETSVTVDGLTGEVAYGFRVSALNTTGAGPSVENTVTIKSLTLSAENVSISVNSVTVTAGTPLSDAELPVINIPTDAKVNYSAMSAISGKDLGGVSFNPDDTTFSITPSRLGIASYTMTVTGDGVATFGSVSIDLEVKSKYVITASDLPNLITPVLVTEGASGDLMQLNSGEDHLYKIAYGDAYIPDNDRTTPFSFTEPFKWFAFKNESTTSLMVTVNNGVVTVGTPGVIGQTALNIVINEDNIMDDPFINYTATIKGFSPSTRSVYNGFGIVSSTGIDDSVSKAFNNNLPVNTGDTTTGTFKLGNGSYLSIGFVSSYDYTVSFEGIEIMPVSTSLAAVPSAPEAVSITGITGTSMDLSWSAPANQGYDVNGNPVSVSGYKLEYSTSSTGWIELTTSGTVRLRSEIGTGTIATVEGLTGSTIYNFRVKAINSIGTGSPSPVTTAATKIQLTADNVSLSSSSVTVTAGMALSAEELPAINIPTGVVVDYSAMSAVSGKDLGGVTFNPSDATFSIAPSVLGKANYTVTVTGDGVTAFGEVTLNLEVKSKYVITADDLSLPTMTENGNRYIMDNSGRTSSLTIYSIANNNAVYLPLNTDAEFTHTEVIKTLALRLQTTSGETVSANSEGRVTVGDLGAGPGDMVYIMVLHEDQIFDDSSINYQLTMKNYISTSSSSSGGFNGFSVITATGAAGGSTFKARTYGTQASAADKTIGSFTIEDGRYVSIAVVSTYGSVVEFDSIEIFPQ